MREVDPCACSGGSLARLLRPAVMAILAKEDLHGYALLQRLEASPALGGTRPDPAGVYRLLKALQKERMVQVQMCKSAAGPDKRIYHLTVKGRACLARWSGTLHKYWQAIGALLETIDGQSHPDVSHGSTASSIEAMTLADGSEVDTLDIKTLLLTHGVVVEEAVYDADPAFHLSRDPMECSTLFLPDNTVVHVALTAADTPYRLKRSGDGQTLLCDREHVVAPVRFPRATRFYQQATSRGVPYKGLAILQGHDVLTFPYLWPCEYAAAGQPCRFCHCGNYTQHMAAMGTPLVIGAGASDVAEVVRYAVCDEQRAKYIQLTGGSTHQTSSEYGRILEMLAEIDRVVGIGNIPGEIILYITPATDLKQIDKLFDAGIDRISCDIELWDEEIARKVCPGKYRWTGRERHLQTLSYVARRFGRNRAMSTFVVGLEPAESFLAGAETLAREGIVPIPSIWMPHGLPPIDGASRRDLAFFRQVRAGLAEIYAKYACEPPGAEGFNVCLCRDTWNKRDKLIAR
jgi:DNA-binding PadR family transcriptional regulator